MSPEIQQFTMRDLVARTHVSAGTIRYYLSVGVLPAPTRASANRFLYDERHVEAIRVARLLRDRRGLSLEAIAQLLPDLLPDVVGQPEGGVFRPEMWGEVIETRSRLLAGPSAAQRLIGEGLVAFSQRGYLDVTVDDICQATAIAKGSFYRHFGSKEELFFAVARAAGEKIVERFTELSDQGGRDGAQLIGYLTAALIPFVSILLDLGAQAARRRTDHAGVLRNVASDINAAVSRYSFGQTDHPQDPFAQALGGAIRQLVDSPSIADQPVEQLRKAAN